jgi:hypothetical protein
MDDTLELLNQLEQAHRDVLTGMLYSWAIAVNLFRIGDHALLDRVPSPAEVKTHEKFLSDLIKLGEFFRPRIKDFGPDDLERYGLERGSLLTTITELEEMTQERKEIL